MRFLIHLKVVSRNTFLPVDYQYFLASAVYKQIERGDHNYSNFLHNKGYTASGPKHFKLFTFSPLSLGRYRHWKDKGLFELLDRRLTFTISFMADEAANVYVKGMFMAQQLSVGDRFNQITMEVTAIEALPRPFFTRTMRYRTLGPLCLKWRSSTRKHDLYLAPDDQWAEEVILQNLIAKAAALDRLINTPDDSQELQFEVSGSYRPKLHVIKPYTAGETRIRGFLFEFRLTAPEYMHELGYYSGFGANNAMGFGAVEALG